MHYLYIKTHNITGLKYLGQTSSKDPFQYSGSGKYWKLHIKKHGYDIKTQILLASNDKKEIDETGIFFSKIFNVMNSNEWANLKEECGQGFGSQFSKELQEKRVSEGTHNFQGGEIQRNAQNKLVSEGRHHLQSGELQRETCNRRVKEGTHNLQGKNHPYHRCTLNLQTDPDFQKKAAQKRKENGNCKFSDKEWQKANAEKMKLNGVYERIAKKKSEGYRNGTIKNPFTNMVNCINDLGERKRFTREEYKLQTEFYAMSSKKAKAIIAQFRI